MSLAIEHRTSLQGILKPEGGENAKDPRCLQQPFVGDHRSRIVSWESEEGSSYGGPCKIPHMNAKGRDPAIASGIGFPVGLNGRMAVALAVGLPAGPVHTAVKVSTPLSFMRN